MKSFMLFSKSAQFLELEPVLIWKIRC